MVRRAQRRGSEPLSTRRGDLSAVALACAEAVRSVNKLIRTDTSETRGASHVVDVAVLGRAKRFRSFLALAAKQTGTPATLSISLPGRLKIGYSSALLDPTFLFRGHAIHPRQLMKHSDLADVVQCLDVDSSRLRGQLIQALRDLAQRLEPSS